MTFDARQGNTSLQVVDAVIECPDVGAWWADVITTGQLEQGAPVDLVLGDATWSGTVIATRLDGGRGRARVIGGAGGLSTPVPATWYRSAGVTLEVVSRSILGPTSEALGEVPTVSLGQWQTYGQSAGRELDRLADAVDLRWYVGLDGFVSWASSNPDDTSPPGELIAETESHVRYASPEGFAALAPVAIEGYDARHVRHVLRGGTATTTYRAAAYAPPDVDRRSRASRLGRVVSQTSQLVDVQLDDGWTMSGVPLYCGVPGMRVEVAADTRVVVLWASDDPRQPVALLTPVDGPAPSVLEFATTSGMTHRSQTPGAIPRRVIREGDLITVTGLPTGPVLTITAVAGPTGLPSDFLTT